MVVRLIAAWSCGLVGALVAVFTGSLLSLALRLRSPETGLFRLGDCRR